MFLEQSSEWAKSLMGIFWLRESNFYNAGTKKVTEQNQKCTGQQCWALYSYFNILYNENAIALLPSSEFDLE